MGEMRPERVVWPRERRKVSRRDVVKGIVLGVPALAGTALLGKKVFENQPFKGSEAQDKDQEAALALIEEAKRKNEIIEAKIVNSEDPQEKVNVRKTPAIGYDNWLRYSKPGTEIKGIMVAEVEGYQQATRKLSGTWFAFELAHGKVGFVHTDYVRRVDGQPLWQLGARIYNIRSGSSFPLAPSETIQR